MALALQPTLVEIRSAVLERCGLAQEGNVPRNLQSIIDEKIRSAQLQLYELYPWLQTYVARSIPLVNAVTDYDIPDDTEPGKITYLAIRRLSDGWVNQLEPGVRPMELNYYAQTMTKGSMPLRFFYIDNVIRIEPAPDTTYYDALMLAYFQLPPPFIEDGERAVVDGEALKMLSEILVKQHFGGQETGKLEEQLGRYVVRVQVKQSDGEGFMMGGHRSLVGRTQKRNRFAWSGIGANTWRDWRPW